MSHLWLYTNVNVRENMVNPFGIWYSVIVFILSKRYKTWFTWKFIEIFNIKLSYCIVMHYLMQGEIMVFYRVYNFVIHVMRKVCNTDA